jgi:hypothetical protein
MNNYDETVYRDKPTPFAFCTYNKKKPHLSPSDWVDKTIRDNSVKNVLKSRGIENKPSSSSRWTSISSRRTSSCCSKKKQGQKD